MKQEVAVKSIDFKDTFTLVEAKITKKTRLNKKLEDILKVLNKLYQEEEKKNTGEGNGNI